MAESGVFKLARRSDGHAPVAAQANEPPVADQTRQPRPELRRRLRPSGAGALPAGSAGARPSAVPVPSVPGVLRSSGDPLPTPVSQEMGARFGTDFSQVRVHADAAARDSAADLGARAYTSGSHIVIGDGGADKHTIAHELSHVIQQHQGSVAGTDHGHGFRVSDPADRDEQAAEADAQRVLSGAAPARPSPTPAGHPLAGAGTAAGIHVQRAVTLGRRKGATAKKKRQHVVQKKVRLNVRAADSTISGISDMPSRPPSSLRSKQGQHLTAYVVFERAVENRVRGWTPEEAVDGLIELVEEYENLPGMAHAEAYLKRSFQNIKDTLTAASESGNAADVKRAVEEAVPQILKTRNQVPGTAEGGTGGGHNEAGWAGKLDALELALSGPGVPAGKKQVEADEAREAMWRLLSYNPPSPKGDPKKEAKISKNLLTHYQELQRAWPRTWAWLEENNYPLENYLKHHRAEDGMPFARLSDAEVDTAIDEVKAEL